MNILRYENGVPVFLQSVIDLYGFPDYYGIDEYLVIADTQSPMVSDYHFEQERRLRPIHRYNRVERFSSILAQLLGLRQIIPYCILDEIQDCTTYQEIRNYLKRNQLQKYYNSIPAMMRKLGLPPPIDIDMNNSLFRLIVSDFRKIQHLYDAGTFGRVYFPSLRYVAIRLLEMHGASVEMDAIRTKRKLKSLDELWAIIMCSW